MKTKLWFEKCRFHAGFKVIRPDEAPRRNVAGYLRDSYSIRRKRRGIYPERELNSHVPSFRPDPLLGALF
jgi:hypothetical protein